MTTSAIAGFNPLVRRSAPVGAVASAYAATRPHASAHGFTDASFQPAFEPHADGQLDARAAAYLAAWANKAGPNLFPCLSPGISLFDKP